MDLQQEIGRLLMVGIPGPTLDIQTRGVLERLRVGGVILFRRNVGTPAEIAALTSALRELPSRPRIAIDHEGGRVMRLGEPFTAFPAAAAVGRRGDAGLAQRIGQAMAHELASVGIDIDFAPVLDVDSNPLNPVIGDRAFGADPALVSAMGIALMRGLLAGGVLPCGKHFPGHGDTEKDSHLELPTVRRTRAELERTELAPFRAAIAAGIPMLMSAHVLYPALDADHPATLSYRILTELLRHEMGFRGVLVSDDLEMRAISDQCDIGIAAVATLQAGADMLLICQSLDKAERAACAIKQALADRVLERSTVAAAVARVEQLRQLLKRASGVVCQLPNTEHRALVQALA